MDAVCRCGWMDTSGRSVSMDAVSRGDWMDALSTSD